MQDGIFHGVGCLRSTRARAPASESSSSPGIPRRRGHLLAGGDRAAVTMSTRSAEPRVVPPRQRWATRDLVVWQGRVSRPGGEVEPGLRGLTGPAWRATVPARCRGVPGRIPCGRFPPAPWQRFSSLMGLAVQWGPVNSQPPDPGLSPIVRAAPRAGPAPREHAPVAHAACPSFYARPGPCGFGKAGEFWKPTALRSAASRRIPGRPPARCAPNPTCGGADCGKYEGPS